MKRLLAALTFGICGLTIGTAQAQPTAVPPNILAANNLPMVMLSASKDFTMFWKAYTDFDDIDLDGTVDRTFVSNFRYYGYFDPVKCYTYNSGASRFEPSRLADQVDKTVVNGVDRVKYYCTAGAGEWSGNFLNWVTMSRIDVLRKVLYGGLRSTDTADDTTLELSFVPRNSQAIVKYYNGDDLDRLTAFNSDDAKDKGLTFCRRPQENEGVSHAIDSIPEIRTVVGNVILWNMTEVRTCNWSSEIGYSWKPATIDYLKANYVTPKGTLATGHHEHLGSVPAKSDENTSYVARVQACNATLLGTEKCRNYGTQNAPKYKPSGLLHEFGESLQNGVEPARAEFGLMLGSYDHNLDGGKLRKNMGQINDEINPTTGVFVAAPSGGIIDSLNKITLYNYNIGTGNYGETCYSDNISTGKCPSWGNPVGELLLEAMRYFAGTETPLYTTNTKDNAVGLPAVAAWTDPLTDNPAMGASTRTKLYGQPICRPLNMLTVTSGSNSYDHDAYASITDLGAASGAAATLTTQIGTAEGITGVRLVGETASLTDRLCTGKEVTALGEVKGVCADGPNFFGTYLGAGVAYYANTNKIRSDFTSEPADLPGNALMVRNYGVSMSGGVATIPIPLEDGNKVYITPASRDTASSKTLPGNMVDFKILSRSDDGRSGAALVLWQHNMLGEDQDQDMLGALRWETDTTTTPWQVKVYTVAVESDTGSGAAYSFGYTLVGTTDLDGSASDGVHFHSGINLAPSIEEAGSVQLSTGTIQGANATDTSVCGGRLCSVVDGKTTRGETYKTYKVATGNEALIKEPLWFISKYGGFKYEGPDSDFPDLLPNANTASWDTKRADAAPCGGNTGVSCSDGEPDNYFVARSPELLDKSLREILQDIVNSSNTSPAIASSQLRTGDLKYVAKFDSGDGRGELAAYAIDDDTGQFLTEPQWQAHEQLTKTSAITRPVITNNGGTGAQFQWLNLDTDKQTALKSGITDPTKAEKFAKDMMQWLRGDTSDQSQFRVRSATSVLGPIVNSNPTVQIPPNGNYFGPDFAGYGTFVTAWKSRKSILWVGAGDGMLHGFDASNTTSGGTPVMSYIPEPVFARLPNWASATEPRVQAFVDGSPFVGDVMVSSAWKTYLFSALGRGAKAIFALDVTDPAVLAAEANASSVFKWQFTAADDADLGYVISEPTVSRFSNQAGQIARMNNGKFAALFGNGVMSSSGKAALYILFADGPASGSWSERYVKIVADTGPDNGLSQPIWVDENNDGIADAIYAGDLKGNLWKFDVSSDDSDDWAVAYSGHALFKAIDEGGQALPITGAPEYRFHPMGGLMVNIATGKSFTSGDFPNTTRVNAIFGIWDNPIFATTAEADLETTLPRTLAQLEKRNFVAVGSGLDRYVSGTTIDWTSKKGWYLPYIVSPDTESSEMTVSNMAMANGQVVAVSVEPPAAKADPDDPDLCFPSPIARLTAVNAMTGMPEGELLGSTKITLPNGDEVTVSLGSIGVSDQKVRISKDSVGTGDAHNDGSCGNGQLNCSRIVGETTDKGLASVNSNARIFWREIPGLKTREVK